MMTMWITRRRQQQPIQWVQMQVQVKRQVIEVKPDNFDIMLRMENKQHADTVMIITVGRADITLVTTV